MFNLDDITLYALSEVVDDELVLGPHVGFRYWQHGYCRLYPQIEAYEERLKNEVSESLKSVTVGELLAKKGKKQETKVG